MDYVYVTCENDGGETNWFNVYHSYDAMYNANISHQRTIDLDGDSGNMRLSVGGGLAATIGWWKRLAMPNDITHVYIVDSDEQSEFALFGQAMEYINDNIDRMSPMTIWKLEIM